MFQKATSRLIAVVLACVMVFGTFGTSVQASGTTSTSGPQLTIDGKPNAVIVLPDDASDMEKLAMEELQEHMELVSGTRLPTSNSFFAGDVFSADISPANLTANKSGYYPVTVSLYNPTNADKVVTLAQDDAAEGMPKVAIKGDADLPENTVAVKAGEKVIVNGLLSIPNPSAFYEHDVVIYVNEGNTALDTLKIHLVTNRSIFGDMSFEKGISNWVGGTLDTANGRSGKSSMKVGASAELALPLNNGELYYIGFWAKAGKDGTKLNVNVTDLDANGAALSVPLAIKSHIQLGTDWAYYEYRFTANTYSVKGYGSSILELSASSNVWVDDFIVVNCGSTDNELGAQFADFEYDPETAYQKSGMYWYTWGKEWKPVTEEKFTGNQSYKITSVKEEAKLRWTYGLMKGSTDKAHTVSFWAKAKKDGTPLYASLYVRDTETHYDQTFYLTTEWTRYEFSCLPTGIGKLGVHAYFNIPADQTATEERVVYLDNIMIANTQAAEELAVPEIGGSDMGDESTAVSELAEPFRPECAIIIGTSESFPQLKELFADDITYLATTRVSESEAYGPDGFAIRQQGNNIYIFGNDKEGRGALNGVYDFIEENLGVLWIRAQDTVYQEMKTVQAVKTNYREKSPFAIRGWNTTGVGGSGYATCDKDADQMLSRNKLNTKYVPLQPHNTTYAKISEIQNPLGLESFYASHNMVKWLRTSSAFDPNESEYWNRDEEGIIYNDEADDPYVQVNFWSEKTSSVIAQGMLDFLEKNPNVDNIGIGVNDTTTFTQYPEQTIPYEYAPGKFVQPTNPRYLSTVYYSFINRIARILAEKYPDITLTTFSYNFVEPDPLCEVDEHVRILYAPAQEDVTDPMDTTEKSNNNKTYQYLERIKLKTRDVVFYNYYGTFAASAYYPRPLAQRIQADLQYYASNGFLGMLPEGPVDYGDNSSKWAMNHLTQWLYAKLAWDPYADVEELTKEFCNKVYGAAGDAMYQFYKTIEKAWNDNKQDMNVVFYTALTTYLQKFVIGAGIAPTITEQLNQAWELADDTSKERIRYIKEAFDKTISVVSSLESEEAIATYTTAGKDKILQTFDMSDPIWKDAVVLDNFYKFTADGPYTIEGIETHLRLMWDGQYLYVAYENFDPGIGDIVNAPYLNADGTWWVTGGEHNGRSDHHETWLTTNTDERFYVYFGSPNALQFRCYNDAGNIHDKTEVDWSSAAKIMDDRWVLIQAISFSSFGVSGAVTTETEVYGCFDRAYYELPEDSADYFGWNGAASCDRGYLTRIQLVKNGASDVPGGNNGTNPNAPVGADAQTGLVVALVAEAVLIVAAAALAFVFYRKKNALDAQ